MSASAIQPQKFNESLLKQIRDGVIGEGQLIKTPFGLKPLVYADYTASGRSLEFIEDYIREYVLPYYANTHSEASATGRQTMAYREQARAAIAKSINASEDYAVIFSGSGATAAINKIIDILELRLPANLKSKMAFNEEIADQDRPVVFIGPYEHHSNELPWRESIAEVVRVPLNRQGTINLQVLESELQRYQDRKLKIGSFSAASNVTGIATPIKRVAALLQRYGALSFWDYAAAAPYVDIDMQGNDLDAAFISTHKFVGGPGTPGLLVVKRSLLNNTTPSVPGGGTVSWVTASSHRYLPAGERREEGGTPSIVESIRAGLVFQLKDRVGANNIEALEQNFIQRAISRLSKLDNVEILGGTEADRISILSFQVRCAGRYLHYGFVVALLNDVFGIQARGGCSCAGPYGHELLAISEEDSEKYFAAVSGGAGIMKPGWVRVNFNYFIGEETFEYILAALELIAEHGWKLLNRYTYDEASGIWVCSEHRSEVPLNLDGLWPRDPEGASSHLDLCCTRLAELDHYLVEAETLFKNPLSTDVGTEEPRVSEHSEPPRWYTKREDIQS